MPRIRTPIDRPVRTPITKKALDAFGHMLILEWQCTCVKPPPERYWESKTCAACEEWWQIHRALSRELRARPCEFPCVIEPTDDDDRRDPLTRNAKERRRALMAALQADKAHWQKVTAAIEAIPQNDPAHDPA